MSGRDNRENSQREEGLFCNLSALDEAQRTRRALLDVWLQVGTVAISELPDGYEFHLDPVSLAAQHVEELIALEKQCCPFLRIDLRRDPAHHGVVVLEVRGGHGIKAFVVAQYGIRGDASHAG